MLLVLLVGSSLFAQNSSRAVKDYQPCQIGGLEVVQTDRLASRPMVRSVTTSKGERDITMLDGYRIVYVLPPEELMLNMKYEWLEPSTYEQQKADLIDAAEKRSRDNGMQPEVKHRNSHGDDAYTETSQKLEGGVLSISQIFDDNKHTVMTIYYLNQEPEKRAFKTMPEFLKLRDRILTEAQNCMSAP